MIYKKHIFIVEKLGFCLEYSDTPGLATSKKGVMSTHLHVLAWMDGY